MSSTTSRPMGGRVAYTPWGSSKVQRTLSVTNEAWDLWTATAEGAATNRSELFEVLSRLLPRLDVSGLKEAVLSGEEKEVANALKGCLK